MIKPVNMKKVSAVVLEDKKDAVLRDLKERGVIHLLKVEEGDESDIELTPGRTAGINVRASEYLTKLEAILDVFQLAKGEDKSLMRQLTEEAAPPAAVEELSPSKLFKEVEDKLSGLQESVSEISTRLEELKKETEEAKEAREVISKLKLLNIGPSDFGDFESTFIGVGMMQSAEIPALNDEISEHTDLFYLQSVELNKTESVIILMGWKEFEADVRRIMHIHRFEELRMPANFSHLKLDEAEGEIDSKLNEITKEEEKLLAEIKELRDANEQDLLLLRESLQIEKLLDETNTFFGNTEATFVLRGWVPTARVDEILSAIEESSDGHSVTLVEDPTKEEEHHHHIPTLLNNVPPAKPMEMLTNTYGVPTYGRIDPSLLMTISFPIIFGLMFGDVGQGLVLVALGYLIGFHFKMDDGPKKLGRILLLCGLAATGAGFLYGEVFGLEGIVPALWIHPMHDTMTLIQFSFYIAIAQLSLGCFVNIADELGHGKPLHAIFSPWGIMGLWLFWGGATLLMRTGVDGLFVVLFGLFDPTLVASSVQTLFLPFLLPVGMIAVGGKYVEGLTAPWSIYEAYEAFTRFLFNSISYIRVGALAIVHAVFASVMNMGMEASPYVILTVLIFICGNIFIIAFETLISFIQALRLHYYEWFSKFYDGGGNAFGAFEVLRKYTYLAPVSAR
jgi:V/A-type H+-transporting ATPase subunit I